MTHEKKNNIDFEDFSPVQKWMKKYIVNPFINYVLHPSFLKHVLRKSKSELAHESLRAPGNWKSMMISYDNKDPKDFIDAIVLRYGSFPAGLRNRKKLVVEKLSGLIRTYKPEEKIIIVGIGCARADNALESIKESGCENAVGYFIDNDDEAMEPGEKLAESMGLLDRVHYIRGDAVNLKDFIPGKAHILKLIGIIEYLTDEQVKSILRVGFENLAPGGTIITHSIQPTHGIEPFLQNVFNLHLIYRTREHVKSLLEEIGFSIIDEEEEPLGIYNIIIGMKQKNAVDSPEKNKKGTAKKA